MSKIGLTVAAGLILATGVWGMSRLAAFQDAGEGGAANAAAAAENPDTPNLEGRTEVAADADPAGGDVTVAGEVAVAPDSNASAVNVSVSGMMSSDGIGMAFGSPPTAQSRRTSKEAKAEFSRRSAREVDEQLNEIIQTKQVENLSFPGENPLTDILTQISSQTTETWALGFRIVPDLKALNDDAVVLQDVQIKDIQLDGISISSALDLIFRQTAPELTWVVKDEVVLITTVAAAESDEYMFLRSYDISQLRDISQLTVTTWTGGGMGGGGMGGGCGGGMFSVPFAPTQFGGGMGGGGQAALEKTLPSKPETRVSTTDEAKQQQVITWEAGLMSTVKDMSSPPCRWYDVDGEGGRISVAGNRLLVRQSRKGHEQVVAVLEQLEMAAEDIAAESAK